MTILGIESSCDETSIAIVQNGKILSNIISSQWVHRQFGGVVPEISARAHLRLITEIADDAFTQSGLKKADIDAVAVTYGPGLMGALLVGVNFAKSLAYSMEKPLIGMNHIESHLYANFVDGNKPQTPFIGLIVSGGHTLLVKVEKDFSYQLLGSTRDDAAGEAFDKVAKMLNLGYPGGPQIDKLASTGNSVKYDFPRPMMHSDDFDFSFSGLKTAVLHFLKNNRDEVETNLNDICASVQSAIVDVLVSKTKKAARKFKIKDIVIAGGVSANSDLRKQFQKLEQSGKVKIFLPPPILSTDNAAMVALLAELKFPFMKQSDWNLSPVPNLSIK